MNLEKMRKQNSRHVLEVLSFEMDIRAEDFKEKIQLEGGRYGKAMLLLDGPGQVNLTADPTDTPFVHRITFRRA